MHVNLDSWTLDVHADVALGLEGGALQGGAGEELGNVTALGGTFDVEVPGDSISEAKPDAVPAQSALPEAVMQAGPL
jgi:hypothetical protein